MTQIDCQPVDDQIDNALNQHLVKYVQKSRAIEVCSYLDQDRRKNNLLRDSMTRLMYDKIFQGVTLR